MCLLASVSVVCGCQKQKSEKASESQAALDPNSVRQSLRGLEPQLNALDTKFADLRKQVEAMPSDVPGFGPVRAKFYATEEGRGIMGAKFMWLSERLDSAQKSRKREELEKVSKDVAKTYDEVRQIDQIALELVHQLSRLQRVAALRAKEAHAEAASVLRILPTNYELRGAWDGIERRLLQILEEPKKKADPKAWFDFDRVYFTGPGPELDRDLSRHQLENVSEILKAYPRVKLTIGGYTENTGDAAANLKLSQERAQAVKEELVQFGVPAARLEARGYGGERPICPANDTDACRSKNRRIAVQITAK